MLRRSCERLNSPRVLIVSPHVPPANGADSHRVRMTVPFFEEFGWNAEVLAVNPEHLAVPKDPWLSSGFPNSVPIHRSDALSLRWSSIPGFGGLAFRARRNIRNLGTKLLRQRRFDLVYFSTTVFSLCTLGPYWKRCFGVPFVIDYQDPWITDYYHEHPQITPPGGKLKYSVIDFLARCDEPSVIRDCAGITAVSIAYADQLRSRYPFASELDCLTIPFPGSARDLERIRAERVTQSCFDANDGLAHWVYVGAASQIMSLTLEALLRAVALERDRCPEKINRIRLHFIGTSYAPAGTGVPFVKAIADRVGVGDLIDERTDRIPCSEAFACLHDAHALIAVGSNDSTYNASKLMPYLLAKKPFLAVFHERSPATSLLRKLGGANLVTFDNIQISSEIAERIQQQWIQGDSHRVTIPFNEAEANPYMDRGQAKLLCEFFNGILARHGANR